jgi:hypothetical protein
MLYHERLQADEGYLCREHAVVLLNEEPTKESPVSVKIKIYDCIFTLMNYLIFVVIDEACLTK